MSLKRNFKSLKLFSLILLICVIFLGNRVESSIKDEIIRTWAEDFGNELWDLAEKMTKASEIKTKYKQFNARVEQKNGEQLIESIAENVGRMLVTKMNAVNRVAAKAEEAAMNFQLNETAEFTYYSSKYSMVNDRNFSKDSIPESVRDDLDTLYRKMYFYQDSHFYDIYVNTTHSSVHVPTNVYDKALNSSEFIQWSEELDEVFRQNYNSDPALSWQYFGSSTGIMRHYPAMEWERDPDNADTYDCRKRSWYIETATCSKDVVLLLDNSGSMTGYRNYIAQLTIRSLLDTFSNNDFVNIFLYSKDVEELIPCFNDTLVQATPENIRVFNEAIADVKPEGKADVKKALSRGFELLEKYRRIRKCSESSSGCNQAIMLVTDGVAGNATDVFEKYNWGGNGTTSPVRVFTYLLGKEVTKVREIQWMACLNRGYYSHIQSIDEVAEEVLKYVTVIAAPLVLQGEQHPPTWTHAFTDFFDQDEIEDDDQSQRLMIAVGVPAFNRKINPETNRTIPSLLGVAGTDIPLEEINKLALPYKLGVNGYSFIVSNNGYVLFHPDLRPLFKGILKDNYNSIDLTEIEQIDEELPPREPSQVLLELRKNLVFSKTGKMLKVPVRFHFDKMRRVSQQYQDFYYTPLPHTPFSLGLALPHEYGNTWIKVGDEVKRNQHMKINISDYFTGENWRVHPEWVYCRYHYLEGHEFQTNEEEILHFLRKLNEPNFKWSQQYEEELGTNEFEPNFGRKLLDDDDFYCNKELVQLLIFDAKVTNNSYRSWKFESEEEREIIEKYNATIRFVSTMSGLTRWQFIFGEVEVDSDQEFGDYHKTAIDETWYKSAILQQQIDPQSFIYSVPHDEDEPEEGELKVTAAMSIFPTDGGQKAPGAVVGFQFSHELMLQRLMEITSKAKCDNCIKTCDSDEVDCYVIDNDGYIILSESQNDTGKFFGEVEGAIMKEMVNSGIFKKLAVYDLQGLCLETIKISNDANLILSPIRFLLLGIEWFITEIAMQLATLNIFAKAEEGDFEDILAYDDNDDYSMKKTITDRPKLKSKVQDEEEYFSRKPEPKYKNISYSCDLRSDLYVLNQMEFIQGRGYTAQKDSICSRPHFVKRIPKSNLLLIVVDAMHSSCVERLTTVPQQILYDPQETPFPCHKLKLNDLPRRRLEECFTEHADEEANHYCGSSHKVKQNIIILIAISLFVLARQTFF